MINGFSSSHSPSPIETSRPKGSARFEMWAPKPGRRITLFDPLQVRLMAYLEGNPCISNYCERAAYWPHGGQNILIDFWVKTRSREVCLLISPSGERGYAGMLNAADNITVWYVPQATFTSRTVWIENWMRMLPYLSINTTLVSTQLLCDVEKRLSEQMTLGMVEREFHPNDVVLIRTAVFLLLHQGRLWSAALRSEPLGAGILLSRRQS